VVFDGLPTEAALLEAFVVTYDELGLDERGTVNPFFVEWVTGPPAGGGSDVEAQTRVHRRLVTLSSRRATVAGCRTSCR